MVEQSFLIKLFCHSSLFLCNNDRCPRVYNNVIRVRIENIEIEHKYGVQNPNILVRH